jgi:hypothetical protein
MTQEKGYNVSSNSSSHAKFHRDFFRILYKHKERHSEDTLKEVEDLEHIVNAKRNLVMDKVL